MVYNVQPFFCWEIGTHPAAFPQRVFAQLLTKEVWGMDLWLYANYMCYRINLFCFLSWNDLFFSTSQMLLYQKTASASLYVLLVYDISPSLERWRTKQIRLRTTPVRDKLIPHIMNKKRLHRMRMFILTVIAVVKILVFEFIIFIVLGNAFHNHIPDKVQLLRGQMILWSSDFQEL